MLLGDLSSVLAACAPTFSLEEYRGAVVDDNVAAKQTLTSRQRTFRYLRELYALDLDIAEFRALLRLWRRAREGRPVVALLMAVSRDPALAATASAVVARPSGAMVTSQDLSEAVEESFPDGYSRAVRDKIGRNALSSWTQAGYLERVGRSPAVRRHVDVPTSAVCMALVLGSAAGLSGDRLFSSAYARMLNEPLPSLHDRAHEASRRGWLEFLSHGAVTQVDVSALTADGSDTRLPITEGDGR